MTPKTRLIAGVACWAGPLLIGAVAATLIAARPPGGWAGRGNQEALIRRLDPTDRERLQGSWIATSVERDGIPIYVGEEAEKARVTFNDDEVTFLDGDVALQGTFRLDQTSSPKKFDLIVPEGNASRSYPVGIYDLDDSEFHLCFAFPAPKRPTRFETRPGSNRTLFVYRRAGQENRATRDGRAGSVLFGLALTTFFQPPKG